MNCRAFFLIGAMCLCAAPRSEAQQPALVERPPASVAEQSTRQALISRDADRRPTLRAVRLDRPMVLDGRLDEEVYGSVAPAADFIQQEPDEGQPATNRTDLWIFFDDKNLYVAARCWIRPEDIISNEMRRDHLNIFINNDSLTVLLDTFHDQRTAYFVQSNPHGGVRDGYLPDENRNVNFDFNLVWDVRTNIFDQGWTVEMVVPFKSIRYAPGREQTWGLNVLRMDRKINEASSLSPVPASYGPAGIFKVSSAGTLVGLQAPASGGLFDVRPAAVADLSQDRQGGGSSSNADASFGVDAKYKVTKSLNLDFTYNTDFAQVEVDNQQLNLTRFSLFYPEKREFFLEGQSNFTFGSTFVAGQSGSFGGGQQGSEAPIFFFSRQIGLVNGQTVPIAGGGRLMGRVGAFNVGAMTIRTKDAPEAAAEATTFSVVRVRRDILRRSSIGMIATDRRPALNHDFNQVFGVDAGLRFFQNLEVNSYYARSRTASVEGDEATYSAHLRYAGDLYGFDLGHGLVGAQFNPELGFLTRRGFRRNFGSARVSRRPRSFWTIRKVDWEAAIDDIQSTEGILQTQLATATFRLTADSGDQFRAVYTYNQDRPAALFRVAGAIIQPGMYAFDDVRFTYTLGARRPVVGMVSFAKGDYYGGEKTEAGFNGRVPVSVRFSLEPILTLTWLSMPYGRYQAQVVSTRSIYTVTPRMQLSALVQYNSTASSLGTNARFRWEYRPGSDLYLVYTDGRDTAVGGFPNLLNRSVAIKLSRLLQF